MKTTKPHYIKSELPMLKRHILAIENILRAHFSGEIKLQKENIEQMHEELSDLVDLEIELLSQK
jgi:hypothetical protein